MSIRSLLFIFACLLLTGCSSTSNVGYFGRYNTNYKDFLKVGETEVYSKYQFIVSEKVNGDGFVYREFYPETRTLTLEAHFLDKALETRDGPYFVWYDNGTLKESGTYNEGKLTGDCKIFSYDTGLLHIKSSYENGIPHGDWEYYHPEGQLKSKETYVNGLKEGNFVEYDVLGNLSYEGTHQADSLLSQINSSVIDQSQVLDRAPAFCSRHGTHLCGVESSETPEMAWNKFINQRLRYPANALNRNVQGRALVRFLVDLDGTIMNIEVLHGLCESISREVERLIQLSSPWHPGVRNGEPIPVVYYLPISFKLDDSAN